MKSLPVSERPYEKCLEYGESILSDSELLAVILRSGSHGESAVELARRILSLPASTGLSGLCHVSIAELTSIRGIGKVKAIQLKCIAELSRRMARERTREGICFHDPHSIADYYMEDYRHEEQEKVLLIMLDTKNRLIAQQVISMGTVNASLISPREIFVAALKHRAVSIILLHNHPSGNPTPSHDDILLTERIARCGEMLGISLLDHIIIGDQKALSLREEHLLPSL